MLARQRQALILGELQRHGAIRVSDLVQVLGVSDMTVRRDLEALARQGLLDKVHGGATLRSGRTTDEPGFEAKSVRELPEKEAIGRRAAMLVQPGTAVAVTAGTTTHALARHLAGMPGLTVVTNSIRVAQLLHQTASRDQTVILTGGLRTPSDALVGPVAVDALRSLHVDMCFMGVHGMDERTGYTTPNLMEAETNRAMLEAARRLVVVADHTKWGTLGLSRIARLEDASVLVTDDKLPRAARELLQERVNELLVVPAGAPRPEAATEDASRLA
ncbi:MAG: DeoR/GlpR family DNA-binding transcription regulator [Actinomycetota bacterium]|nr:DeoR/GlpR family DNA-binding transcription regulator [Actinomycetota bacterium]